MAHALRRYWLTFERSEVPLVLGYGCGITAWTEEDALAILRSALGPHCAPTEVVADVDVSTLDPGHVLPNMLPPNERGIWFPMGLAAAR